LLRARRRGARSPVALVGELRVLLGRAAYVQIVGSAFFLKQVRSATAARPISRQPRAHRRPQRPDPRVERAGALDLGDSGRDLEGDRRSARNSPGSWA
jgi:hypothetical protein